MQMSFHGFLLYILNERSYFKISTNRDFMFFCENIVSNSPYENFEHEGIYMYLQIKADKFVVPDFLFDIWFKSYSFLFKGQGYLQ